MTTPRLAWGLLAAITLALSWAATGDGVLAGDLSTARWIQAHPLPLIEHTAGFTDTWVDGVPLSVAAHVLAAALLLSGRPGPAVLMTAVAWLRVSNGVLKLAVASPRPPDDALVVTEETTGFGFPSGHAMGAVLVFGAVAYLAARGFARLPGDGPPTHPDLAADPAPDPRPLAVPRRLVVVVCLAVILVVGYGRVLAGVHWPSDVLGGYLWGALLLAVAIRAAPVIARRPRRVEPARYPRST